MYLKIPNKKIEIKEYTTTKERLKSLRFQLEPIQDGIKLPNKKVMNTYWFCQRVDVCFTDESDIIIETIPNMKSEKIRWNPKTRNIYYLPLDTVKHLKIGNKINEKQ